MTKMPTTNYRVAFGHYFEAISIFKDNIYKVCEYISLDV